MNGASTEQIIEQVRKCPSGALSYYLNKEQPEEADHQIENRSDDIIAESANILKIEVKPDGPYLIKTECLIVLADGRPEKKSGTVALCRCGASGNKPYCDGTHRKIEFKG